MLIARNDPLAFLLSTVCATTPTPNTIRMNVPRNSAAASRLVPFNIGDSRFPARIIPTGSAYNGRNA